MCTKVQMILLLALLALTAITAGCGGEDGDVVVARIGHVSITETELNQKLSELAPYTRQQFATPEGRIEFLERMVREEVIYQAAVDAGYENHPDVVKPLEALRKRAVVQVYYREEIEKNVVVSEDDIVAYYEEYDEVFQAPARVKFRHVMTDTKSQAVEARRRVLAGEPISTVARDISTDAATRDAGGLTNSIRLGRGLPRLGMDATFIENLFDWNVGEVTDPLRSDSGWHVIRIEDKVDAGPKPLEEVREDIVQTLLPDATRRHFEDAYEELKSRFNATINEDALRPKVRTEEELFTRAQNTEDPLERLSLYSELLFSYPNGEHAPEAQFMIGFIYAEELESYEAAQFEFQKMLDAYPDSELAESARWMLENMQSEDPEFEDLEGTATH